MLKVAGHRSSPTGGFVGTTFHNSTRLLSRCMKLWLTTLRARRTFAAFVLSSIRTLGLRTQQQGTKLQQSYSIAAASLVIELAEFQIPRWPSASTWVQPFTFGAGTTTVKVDECSGMFVPSQNGTNWTSSLDRFTH